MNICGGEPAATETRAEMKKGECYDPVASLNFSTSYQKIPGQQTFISELLADWMMMDSPCLQISCPTEPCRKITVNEQVRSLWLGKN